MRLSAILMSRVLAFVDTADLRPTSGLIGSEFVQEAVKQFRFLKYPQTVEEFDAQKGIEFINGQIGKKAISKFVIWPNILVIEGRCHTSECIETLGELLDWGRAKFDLTYRPEMIRRYAYVSDLSFESDVPLLTFDPLIKRISHRLSTTLTGLWDEQINCELFDFKIGHDPLTRKWGIAPFQITRRAEHNFTENKYFSEAPLPTDEHIALIEEYEEGILKMQGKATVQ